MRPYETCPAKPRFLTNHPLNPEASRTNVLEENMVHLTTEVRQLP
jgi:hypothetical protein